MFNLVTVILICKVVVWVPVVDDKDNNKTLFKIQSQATLEGKFLSKNDTQYLVDFSKDAQENGFDGNDYKKIFVNKTDCMRK